MAVEVTDRNVYILGAGFSASAGAPLIHDFLDRSREFKDNPSSHLEKFERNYFQEVFDFRREVAQAREKVVIDLDNIEQLFGLVEISQRLEHIQPKVSESMVYLIAKTLQLATGAHLKRRRIGFSVNDEILKCITSLPSEFCEPSGTGSARYEVDLYVYFAGLIAGKLDDPELRKNRHDTVITFNYDLVFDHALRRNAIEPEYHIGESDTPASMEGSHPYDERFSVLKLHGSTNWGVCPDCKKGVVTLEEKVTDSPKEFGEKVCPECGKNSYQPLLIPPSWDKSEYREIMKPVWAKAVEELQKATRICIVGYSMPESDAFFKYLLTLALSKNHQLYKFIVVDLASTLGPIPTQPSHVGAEVVETRYKQLLEPLFQERRFSFYSQGFEMFLGNNRACGELGRGEVVGGNTYLH